MHYGWFSNIIDSKGSSKESEIIPIFPFVGRILPRGSWELLGAPPWLNRQINSSKGRQGWLTNKSPLQPITGTWLFHPDGVHLPETGNDSLRSDLQKNIDNKVPQEWHNRSYWSVMLQTAPEAAELFCNVSLCFVTLSSPPERFPAANGRLGLQRSIWPDPSRRRVGSTAKKMTRHGNTPITHKQKHFDTLSLEMDEYFCSVKEKNPQGFLAFSQMQLMWQLPMFCLMSSYLCEEWLLGF